MIDVSLAAPQETTTAVVTNALTTWQLEPSSAGLIDSLSRQLKQIELELHEP